MGCVVSSPVVVADRVPRVESMALSVQNRIEHGLLVPPTCLFGAKITMVGICYYPFDLDYFYFL